MSPLPFFKKKPAKKQELRPEVQVAAAPKTIAFAAVGVLARPHVTEKASMLAGNHEYVFEVYPGINEFQVKNAVEKTYGVKVKKVNMVNIPPKIRRVGRRMGKTKAVRKAIVRLQKGQTIELLPR